MEAKYSRGVNTNCNSASPLIFSFFTYTKAVTPRVFVTSWHEVMKHYQKPDCTHSLHGDDNLFCRYEHVALSLQCPSTWVSNCKLRGEFVLRCNLFAVDTVCKNVYILYKQSWNLKSVTKLRISEIKSVYNFWQTGKQVWQASTNLWKVKEKLKVPEIIVLEGRMDSYVGNLI